jgi:hypothetical protein
LPVGLATLLFTACFGDSGGVLEATLTVTSTPTVAATSTTVATSTPTPVATATPEATPTPSSTASAETGAACINDPDRSSTIPDLLVGGEAFADDLANIRDDHAIDASRVAQVQGSAVEFSSVQLVDGPWCNEGFTWWLVEAEQAVLPGADGAFDGGSRASANGWMAEIDQFGQTNLSTDRGALGQSPQS